jgi:hypothetical protein
LLAQALAAMPTVLGAAGFDFRAYTTSSGMRSVPLRVMGDDPRPFVRHYPQVLASLPQLQAAASGQALLSVDAHSGGVRRIAMIATVGEQLVPGLALEMFRVGTGDDAIRVTSNAHGVASVRVAELDVPPRAMATSTCTLPVRRTAWRATFRRWMSCRAGSIPRCWLASWCCWG